VQKRFLVFLGLCLGVGLLFAVPLSRLIRLALHHGYSSHIVLVPAIIVYLLWSDRVKICAAPEYAKKTGLAVGAIAVVALIGAFALRTDNGLGASDFLLVLAILLLLMASFTAIFGVAAARKALFPIALMIFVLPVPGPLLHKTIQFLQVQSAELSYWMLTALRVPVLRDGVVMTLPGVTIQVAEECSGINSSVALLILMIVFAHETLLSNWRRLLLVVLVIPLSILKNAFRIVTLTMLAIKVDPSFLSGRLHHQGGFAFLLITIVIVYPIWKILRENEANAAGARQASVTAVTSSSV
jgi:exosortase